MTSQVRQWRGTGGGTYPGPPSKQASKTPSQASCLPLFELFGLCQVLQPQLGLKV